MIPKKLEKAETERDEALAKYKEAMQNGDDMARRLVEENSAKKEALAQVAVLVEATREAMEYFAQREDIHRDNPYAPNEEMHLWEELNNALSNLPAAAKEMVAGREEMATALKTLAKKESTWAHQEELHQELRLQDAKDYRAKINHGKAENARLREALEKITSPMAQRSAWEIAKAALSPEKP